MKLIIPVAGSSTRYQGMRPKWMLTLPDGKLMIEECIKGIDFTNIEEIIIIALEEHIKESNFNINYLINRFEKLYLKTTKIVLLNDQTISQPMTIAKYLGEQENDFPFYIKDCDNYFIDKPEANDSVAFVSLNELNLVAASNKSYIKINHFNEIEQIQEKEIISDTFCVGGYSFKSSKSFLKSFESLDGYNNNSLYVSHIIQNQILNGTRFTSTRIQNYIDYGTSNEFFLETHKASTLLCDFDGVIVKNSSKFSKNPWSYIPIKENIKSLKNTLGKSASSQLIITTSRPFEEKENINKFCKENGLNVKQIITGLPHCKRYLINDFSNSNPYPSATAINLPRNSETLDHYLP